MKEYTPKLVGTVTKYVFIESPGMTPTDFAIKAYEVSEGVMIKETCFGLQVTGMPGEVDRIVEKIRSFDPEHVFVKDRGFPPGDERRCRANLGGARPGYFGHEYEVNYVIRNISHGISALKTRDPEKPADPPSPARKRYLDSGDLIRIIQQSELQ